MAILTSYDVAIFFRDYSFLKNLRQFDIDVDVFPELDTRSEVYIIKISEDEKFHTGFFMVDMLRKIVLDVSKYDHVDLSEQLCFKINLFKDTIKKENF